MVCRECCELSCRIAFVWFGRCRYSYSTPHLSLYYAVDGRHTVRVLRLLRSGVVGKRIPAKIHRLVRAETSCTQSLFVVRPLLGSLPSLFCSFSQSSGTDLCFQRTPFYSLPLEWQVHVPVWVIWPVT
jgi:hypothetical protein